MKFLCILGLFIFSVNGERKIDFSMEVRPILSRNCFACHGPDKSKGKLRLDTLEGIKKSTKANGAHVSEMIERLLTDDEDDVMPPLETGKKLRPEEITLLKKWIAQGADFAEHWSFQALNKPVLPKNKKTHAIDKFIVEKLQQKKMESSPAASKSELIRRVSLDIRGVIPSPAEVASFTQDTSKNSYEKLIDSFLSSPLYGEKWGSKWLDLARYADTRGYEKDRHREIWRYRDWVIAALNQDMPYDEFTIKQIAGDMLPNASADDILATAFHRNTMTNDEGGTDNEEFRTEAVKDRIDSTGVIWLGLSMGCAKCHTHKYDPVTIEEYYSLYSFMNQTEDNDLGNDAPLQRMPSASTRQKWLDFDKKLKEARAKNEALWKSSEVQSAFTKWKTKDDFKWQSGEFLSAEAVSGQAIVQQAGHYFVAKNSGQKDSYTIKVKLPVGNYKALQLNAIPDKRLPGQGSGHDHRGNFVLSWVEVKANDKPQKLKAYYTDYKARRSNAAAVLKPHTSNSGYHVFRREKQQHKFIVEFAQELKVETAGEVSITLAFNNPKSKLGSFDLAFTQASGNYQQYVSFLNKDPKTNFITVHPELRKLAADISNLDNGLKQNLGPLIPIMKERPVNKLRPNYVHDRGFFLNKGKKVTAGTPAFLHKMSSDLPKNRLGFAKWLVDKKNPLVARVAANRIWGQIFGRGIVETEEDFGNQGAMPTHPQLLDWLAVEYMANGWSQKKLIKTILLSDTYCQSSKVSPELARTDRFNLYLGRGPRFRMSAEMIRDSSLKAAGLLSSKMFGPSVMPYQPPGLWKSTYNKRTWRTSKGEDKYRRGLYTYLKRTSPYPGMTIFDGPSREICTARRIRSNTPLQALTSLNDPVFVEAAQALARKVIQLSKTIEERVNVAFQTTLSRPADPTEVTAIKELFLERLNYYKTNTAEAKSMAELPLGALPSGMDAAEAAAWASVCNVILNLDEFLTKE